MSSSPDLLGQHLRHYSEQEVLDIEMTEPETQIELYTSWPGRFCDTLAHRTEPQDLSELLRTLNQVYCAMVLRRNNTLLSSYLEQTFREQHEPMDTSDF